MSSHLQVLNRLSEEDPKNMTNKMKENSEELEWDVSVERSLLFAMEGHKPVGVNRHFMMLFIHHRFSKFIKRQINSKVIWDHLDSMYDMAALHESEIIPFPNDEVDFELPPEYEEITKGKLGASLSHVESDEGDELKNTGSAKSARKLSTSKLKPSNSPVPIAKNKDTPSTKSNVTTPVSTKTVKTSTAKEPKPSFGDAINYTSKSKQDAQFSAKSNKLKRAGSPFVAKTPKAEPPSSKEGSPDLAASKKPAKSERGSSPAVLKKATVKVEVNSAAGALKKIGKEHVSASLKSKSEDASLKKVRHERDSSGKKGKVVTSDTSSQKKNAKVDSVNGMKKQKGDEVGSKKGMDSSTGKQLKVDVKSIHNAQTKGLKLDEADASIISGSRKSMTKTELVDASKTRKRQKPEDSSKKAIPTAKRRRV